MLAFVYFLLAFGVAVGFGQLNWFKYHKLTQHGVQAMAQVTRVEPKNHNSLFYTYQAAGGSYEGQGHIGIKIPQPGDKIGIFYLPNEPAISCYGQPRDLLNNETISILLASIFMPAFLLGALFLRRSKGKEPLLKW